MVDATIYSAYGPWSRQKLKCGGMDNAYFKFENRRELFFCTVRQESRGQRDRNLIFNLAGVSNES